MLFILEGVSFCVSWYNCLDSVFVDVPCLVLCICCAVLSDLSFCFCVLSCLCLGGVVCCCFRVCCVLLSCFLFGMCVGAASVQNKLVSVLFVPLFLCVLAL